MSFIVRFVEKITPLLCPVISVNKAKKLLTNSRATIIDVSTPGEFAETHVHGAINRPLNTLQQEMHALPQGNLMLYCASGVRSQMACKILRSSGREHVYNLGGIARAKRIVEKN